MPLFNLPDCIAKYVSRSDDGENFIYLPTQTQYKDKQEVVDALLADAPTYEEVKKAKSSGQTDEEFQMCIKAAINVVDSAINKSEEVKEPTPTENNEGGLYGNEYEGLLSAKDLRRMFNFRMGAISSEAKENLETKLKSFLLSLSDVEDVQVLPLENKPWLVSVKCTDESKCLELDMKFLLLNDYASFVAKKWFLYPKLMERPTTDLMFQQRQVSPAWDLLSNYFKAYKHSDELNREVLIQLKSPHSEQEIKEFLSEHGLKISRARSLIYKDTHASSHKVGSLDNMKFVQFESVELADQFMNQADSLEWFGEKVRYQRLSNIANLPDTYPKYQFYGDPKGKKILPSLTLFVQLYVEQLHRLPQVKQLLQETEPKEITELPAIGVVMYGMEFKVRTVLLVEYSSKEKMLEAQQKLDDLNEMKRAREWVYAPRVTDIVKKLKPLLHPVADADTCRKQFSVEDDSIVYEKNNNFDKAWMYQWVFCKLAPSEISWSPEDVEEISRYFMENHANVKDVVMRPGDHANGAFVRFCDAESADVFYGLSYVLFLGVPVQRVRLLNMSHTMEILPYLRLNQKKSLQNNNKHVQLTGFKEKFNNKDLLRALFLEADVPNTEIVECQWSKVEENSLGPLQPWMVRVFMRINDNEMAQTVLNLNSAGIKMGGGLITAEMVDTVSRKKKRKAKSNGVNGVASGQPSAKKLKSTT